MCSSEASPTNLTSPVIVVKMASELMVKSQKSDWCKQRASIVSGLTYKQLFVTVPDVSIRCIQSRMNKTILDNWCIRFNSLTVRSITLSHSWIAKQRAWDSNQQRTCQGVSNFSGGLARSTVWWWQRHPRSSQWNASTHYTHPKRLIEKMGILAVKNMFLVPGAFYLTFTYFLTVALESNLGFTILPKETLAYRLEDPGFTPPTSQLVDDLFYLLRVVVTNLHILKKHDFKNKNWV